MLVLTRKLGEGITIGTGIRVVILGVRGNQIRLGIEAPRHTEVYRDEIYAKIVEENRKAAEGAPEAAAVASWLSAKSRKKQRKKA